MILSMDVRFNISPWLDHHLRKADWTAATTWLFGNGFSILNMELKRFDNKSGAENFWKEDFDFSDLNNEYTCVIRLRVEGGGGGRESAKRERDSVSEGEGRERRVGQIWSITWMVSDIQPMFSQVSFQVIFSIYFVRLWNTRLINY